jgi:hypothetical protein
MHKIIMRFLDYFFTKAGRGNDKIANLRSPDQTSSLKSVSRSQVITGALISTRIWMSASNEVKKRNV